jgi:branched-chain amino acid transport system substrate-binding protein
MEKVISDYEHYKYLFRPAHINAAQQPVIVIDFLNRYLKPNYGITKVAIIAENTAWTMDYQKTLQEELPKLGFELVYVARPPLDATDYSVELTQAKEKGAQVIIPIISTSSGTILTKQWAELRIPSLLIGTNNIAVRSEFWGETEGKTNYHMVTMWGGNVSITEKTVPFYNEYVKRWGHDPAYMAWNQYDALFILAEAINNCGSTDPDAIVAALEKIDYVGVTGRIQILKNHETRVEVGYRTLLLAQWQDGKLLFVWPEYVQQADIIIPRWMQEAWG